MTKLKRYDGKVFDCAILCNRSNPVAIYWDKPVAIYWDKDGWKIEDLNCFVPAVQGVDY